jgi:hypothetical protein
MTPLSTFLLLLALAIPASAQDDPFDPMAFELLGNGIVITAMAVNYPQTITINVTESGLDTYNDNPPDWTGNMYWLECCTNLIQGTWYYVAEALPDGDSFSISACLKDFPATVFWRVALDDSEPNCGAHGLLGAGNMTVYIPQPNMWPAAPRP